MRAMMMMIFFVLITSCFDSSKYELSRKEMNTYRELHLAEPFIRQSGGPEVKKEWFLIYYSYLSHDTSKKVKMIKFAAKYFNQIFYQELPLNQVTFVIDDNCDVPQMKFVVNSFWVMDDFALPPEFFYRKIKYATIKCNSVIWQQIATNL